MTRPRLLFIDIDGTLLDYHNRLPQSAAAAIGEARSAGHRVLLCSGRAKAEIPEYLWAIGVDGYVGGNGNYAEVGGEVVLKNSLTYDQCRTIVGWLQARGLEFFLETNAGLFASANFAEVAAPVMRRYAERKGRPAPADGQLGFHGMVFGQPLDRDDVMKISYVLRDVADHEAATLAFPNLQHGVWGGRGAEALFGDVSVEGVTKAVAVQAVVTYLGADPADTVAFGDAAVDIPMFEACGYSVAMGNASPGVLAAADLVTDDVEQDGLAKAFASLGLTVAGADLAT